ncbi:unnamed protein product [Candidula unifasciata]|uniref:Uncharacterized protein n=1 Tax=Candidula unifasciata TaxID=100452 RepID=A0A8S4A4C2_9EUPU|nr:unnamed protein product [Candidula unifasciata]
MARLTKLVRLIWLFYLTDARTPSLNLTKLKLLSPCSHGLRDSKDSLVFQGSADTTGVNVGEWSHTVIFELGQTGGVFKDHCTIDLNLASPVGSSCISISTSPRKYNITVAVTAKSSLSGFSGRLRWEKSNGSNHVISNELTISKVYKPQDLLLSSLVKLENTETQQLEDTGECQIEAKHKMPNTIRLCCSNYTSPCWSNITVDGLVVSWGTPCANYTFTQLSSSSKNLTFAVSSCMLNESVREWDCELLWTGKQNSDASPKRKEFAILIAVSIAAILLTIFAVHMGLKQILTDQRSTDYGNVERR